MLGMVVNSVTLELWRLRQMIVSLRLAWEPKGKLNQHIKNWNTESIVPGTKCCIQCFLYN